MAQRYWLPVDEEFVDTIPPRLTLADITGNAADPEARRVLDVRRASPKARLTLSLFAGIVQLLEGVDTPSPVVAAPGKACAVRNHPAGHGAGIAEEAF